ncbi:hypothetical protein EMPG_15254, partial [Blastomyces silverae]
SAGDISILASAGLGFRSQEAPDIGLQALPRAQMTGILVSKQGFPSPSGFRRSNG